MRRVLILDPGSESDVKDCVEHSDYRVTTE